MTSRQTLLDNPETRATIAAVDSFRVRDDKAAEKLAHMQG